MTDNGRRTDEPRSTRPVSRSGIPPAVAKLMERRAEEFGRATSGRGQPVTFGAGKGPLPKRG